ALVGVARAEQDLARRNEVMAGAREVPEHRVAARIERAREAALDRREGLAEDAELALELAEPARARSLHVPLHACHPLGRDGGIDAGTGRACAALAAYGSATRRAVERDESLSTRGVPQRLRMRSRISSSRVSWRDGTSGADGAAASRRLAAFTVLITTK